VTDQVSQPYKITTMMMMMMMMMMIIQSIGTPYIFVEWYLVKHRENFTSTNIQEATRRIQHEAERGYLLA
jgi:hypothetical protein